jgi:hypothetical protein
MRRAITGFALIALLLFPAAAAARVLFFEGKGLDDENVKLNFELSGPKGDRGREFIELGKAKIEGFEIKRIKFTCTDGYSYRGAAFYAKEIDVQPDGEFQDKFESPGNFYKVRGQLTRNRQQYKARGVYREFHMGAVGGVQRTCDTEMIHFVAHADV